MSDTESNVNPNPNVPHEINIKRVGQQQKEILRWLYARRGSVHKQVDIIESLYGEVTDSRKASVSRSISTLTDHGVTFRQTAYYSEQFDSYIRQRPHFGLTDEGKLWLVADDRFPEIDGADEDCVDCGAVAEVFPDATPLCWECHNRRIHNEVRS